MVAGRLIYRKGILFLIDALKGLPVDLQYQVLIAGEGEEREIIEQAIIEAKLQHKVKLLGKLSYNNMSELYRKVDALIMPSLRETTGSVVLEAMSYGVPVITIDAFGAKNIVVNGVNGFLYNGVNKEDYIKNLGSIMSHVAKNGIDEEMRKAALQTAVNNSWEKRGEEYQTTYDLLLSGHNS